MKHLTPLTAVGFVLLTSCGSPEDEGVDFATEIYPIIHRSCVECHQPPYKNERGRPIYPEAHLVLTEREAIMRGADVGPVLIPGDPEGSEFLAMILLPLDDDDHMPPEGEAPQLTPGEVELLRRWIADGCDFGGWVRDDNYELLQPSK